MVARIGHLIANCVQLSWKYLSNGGSARKAALFSDAYRIPNTSCGDCSRSSLRRCGVNLALVQTDDRTRAVLESNFVARIRPRLWYGRLRTFRMTMPETVKRKRNGHACVNDRLRDRIKFFERRGEGIRETPEDPGIEGVISWIEVQVVHSPGEMPLGFPVSRVG